MRANPALNRWLAIVPPQRCYLSIVSVAEVRLGIEAAADAAFRAELLAWLDQGVRVWFGARILPVDEAVLPTWRRLVVAGQKGRYTYSQPDALIASTALVHGLCVATGNTADFARAGVAVVDPWSTG